MDQTAQNNQTPQAPQQKSKEKSPALKILGIFLLVIFLSALGFLALKYVPQHLPSTNLRQEEERDMTKEEAEQENPFDTNPFTEEGTYENPFSASPSGDEDYQNPFEELR